MDLAVAFAYGEIPNPFPEPTYDFAADWLVAKQGRPCTGFNMSGNSHLPYSCLKSGEKGAVVPGEVVVEGMIPAPSVTLPFVGVFLAGAGALFAWWILTR